jgi:hypothetical protein
MRRKPKSEKPFDAVATMRRIRAEVNEELEGKSFEEIRQYLREHVPEPRSEEQLQTASFDQ